MVAFQRHRPTAAGLIPVTLHGEEISEQKTDGWKTRKSIYKLAKRVDCVRAKAKFLKDEGRVQILRNRVFVIFKCRGESCRARCEFLQAGLAERQHDLSPGPSIGSLAERFENRSGRRHVARLQQLIAKRESVGIIQH